MEDVRMHEVIDVAREVEDCRLGLGVILVVDGLGGLVLTIINLGDVGVLASDCALGSGGGCGGVGVPGGSGVLGGIGVVGSLLVRVAAPNAAEVASSLSHIAIPN